MSVIDSHTSINFQTDTVDITDPCRECRNPMTITVPRKAYNAFRYYSIPIRGAWPEASLEQVLSVKLGLCSSCLSEK